LPARANATIRSPAAVGTIHPASGGKQAPLNQAIDSTA
jgi:hypothetical protein